MGRGINSLIRSIGCPSAMRVSVSRKYAFGSMPLSFAVSMIE
jgi:hypothetical protein